jgi:hypothetical protein
MGEFVVLNYNQFWAHQPRNSYVLTNPGIIRHISWAVTTHKLEYQIMDSTQPLLESQQLFTTAVLMSSYNLGAVKVHTNPRWQVI